MGVFDVLVGINLLREGLDLPEVSLVAILDADKEGFLRSETALIQTIGRAARNADGMVILYADKITPSMDRAITVTEERRAKQDAFNQAHGIVPKTIKKDIRDLLELSKPAEEGHKKGKLTGAGACRSHRPAGEGHEGGRQPVGVRAGRRSARSDHRAEGTVVSRAVPKKDLDLLCKIALLSKAHAPTT